MVLIQETAAEVAVKLAVKDPIMGTPEAAVEPVDIQEQVVAAALTPLALHLLVLLARLVLGAVAVAVAAALMCAVTEKALPEVAVWVY